MEGMSVQLLFIEELPVGSFKENPHFTNCYRYFLPSEGKNYFSFFYKLSAINKFGSTTMLSLGFLAQESFNKLQQLREKL